MWIVIYYQPPVDYGGWQRYVPCLTSIVFEPTEPDPPSGEDYISFHVQEKMAPHRLRWMRERAEDL